MAAFMFLAVKRMNREQHKQLSLLGLANCGDAKQINDQLAKWEKDSD